MDFGRGNRDLLPDPTIREPTRNTSFVSLFDIYDSGSVPSSPAASRPNSTDEREQDEYVAELTRQMADYMLQDDDDRKEKPWRGYGGSPKTTLWSAFAPDRNSSIASSRESSPTSVSMIDVSETTKFSEEIDKDGCSTTMTLGTRSSSIQSKQALIEDQIRAAQLKWQGRVRPASPAATKTEEDESCSGLQDAHKIQETGSGSATGSTGTGVFLPRRTEKLVEPRKKNGGATVLIPARVVQALKFHYEKTGAPSKLGADFPSHQDAMTVEGDILLSPRNGRFRAATPRRSLDEIGLPKEWTY